MKKTIITTAFFVTLLSLTLYFIDVKSTFAIIPGGGRNVSLFTQCTCGPGYLITFVGVPGTPSGLYYIGPSTMFWVGSGFPVANVLMWYTPGAGICMMNSGPSCFSITGHLINWYGAGN